jgi:hypoxanthine phosphoribosyltransferase
MGLFQYVEDGIELHSGGRSQFKIECDALDDKDIECLAWITSTYLVGKFSEVHGVPRGGLRFAKALEKYKDEEGAILIVDDVYTTGTSIQDFTRKFLVNHFASPPMRFVVIFSRNEPPEWIIPIFKMWGGR